MTRRLLWLGAGLPAYEAAASFFDRTGQKTDLIADSRHVYTAHSRIVDELRTGLDTLDEDILLAILREYAARGEKPLLLTADTRYAAILIKHRTLVSAMFHLPLGTCPDAPQWQQPVDVLTWLETHGLPVPPHQHVASLALDAAEPFECPLSYPLMLEPLSISSVNPNASNGAGYQTSVTPWQQVVQDELALRAAVLSLRKDGFGETFHLQEHGAADAQTYLVHILAAAGHLSALAVGMVRASDPTPERWGAPLYLTEATETTNSALTALAEHLVEGSRYDGLMTLTIQAHTGTNTYRVYAAQPYLAGAFGLFQAAGVDLFSALLDRTKRGDRATFAWLAVEPTLILPLIADPAERASAKKRFRNEKPRPVYLRPDDLGWRRRRYLHQQAYFLKKRLQRA